METTTQELIYQFMALLISGILAILGAYVKQLIKTKIDVTKYGFENDKVERIIDNAINFAEQKSKVLSKSTSVKLAGSDKLKVAKEYINKVDKNVVTKYADQLDDMIDRKIAQKFGA
ncbi:phage holin, LLH family [Sulfurimonas sp.]|uniref:phage holin, LLH family n=1 Tax=Sulfurimonas sp. TaxID=2022749 RepID=UPI003565CF52